jgi:hypothetical protein
VGLGFDRRRGRRASTLVIYHYFEKDVGYIENFIHFLLFGCHEDNDHIVVIAGEHNIELPVLPNIFYAFTKNQNKDYGGYCEILNGFWAEIQEYKFVFFVNSSVRGPFLPPHTKGRWTDLFTDRITNDVALVGSTINILSLKNEHSVRYVAKYGRPGPFVHVQTMAYAMPRRTLKHLFEKGFYVIRPPLSNHDIIEDYEIRMSRLVIDNGWNISCLIPEYEGIDYRNEVTEVNPTTLMGDLNHPYGYFGRNAHPFEVMFVKTNRPIFTMTYLDRLAYSALCRVKLSKELSSQPLIATYIKKLMVAREQTAAVHFTDLVLRPDDIVKLTGRLLATAPQFRGEIEKLLK